MMRRRGANIQRLSGGRGGWWGLAALIQSGDAPFIF